MKIRGRSVLLRYGLSIVGTVLAVLVRQLLHPLLGNRFPMVTFFPTVVFAAYFAGIGPALLVMGMSELAAVRFFLAPSDSLLPEFAGWVSLFLFTGFGMAVVLSIVWVRRRFELVEREVNQKLRRSEKRLNEFFEAGAVAMHWVGPDGTILRANKAELDLLGYEKEEYIGHNIAEFHGDSELIEEVLQRLKRGETIARRPHNCIAKMVLFAMY